MSFSRVSIAGLVVASLMSATAPLAQAGQLIPNPATGTNASPFATWSTVTLTPNPALYQAQCSWLYAAATNAAEPYNNVANNPWVFQYAQTFNGTFTLAGFTPSVVNPRTGEDFTAAELLYQSHVRGPTGAAIANRGGATFDISYKPGAGDPTGPGGTNPGTNNGFNGTNVEWIQVIDINQVGWNALSKMMYMGKPIVGPDSYFANSAYFVQGNGTNGVPAGTYAYLDNAGNEDVATGSTPWYGWGSTESFGSISTSAFANANGFFDYINFPFVPGMVVQVQTFLVSDSVTDNDMGGETNTVTIEGGVWWGFQDAAPAPSSGALLVIGCGIVALVRRRALMDRFRSAA